MIECTKMPVKFVSADFEYSKYKDLKKDDIAALLEWNKKQSHLPLLTEVEAIRFFQSCYFKLEPTKTCVENYFTVKTHNPDVFAIQKPSMIKESLECALLTVLPKPTAEGHYIFFGKITDTNADLFNLAQCIAVAVMEVNLKFSQIGTSDGQVIVLDAEGFSLNHLLKINLMLAKKMLFFLQEALPVRLKGIHIFNAGSIIDKFYAMVKPFLSKQLLSIFFLHPKMDTMTIARELLPCEYGGTAGYMKELAEQTKTNLFDNAAFFEKELEKLVDESKRVGKSKYLDEVSAGGVDGSFKKLDFD